MTSLTAPTPQERLASSRKAIVRHMSRDAHDEHDEEAGAGQDGENGSGHFEGGTWGILKHALGAWWHHHPVSVAFGLAKPTLQHYAEEKPLQLLGIAAAAGAATVLIRPWRLVSVGSLLLAAFKSSEISGALLSMLSSASPHSEQAQKSK
ncbi:MULTISPECIES: hypothetical protein [unclassified Polaromonas]|uniref:hypothetical protein n=1 Tax=unclassified Polaromonas TaxID=2638319 RepID=UPI000F08BF77|nr:MULTISPECIES: hypothetical protein [unclassified Polaromonas]AYQ28453.1 hypothetical protein DT070_10725 [Polaromonas sp. SP1]QGJ20427.1 hypothetical protein F7R28_19885 [Polaromonas sp. Pch-P]